MTSRPPRASTTQPRPPQAPAPGHHRRLGRHQLGEALQRGVRGQQRGRVLARRPAAPGRDPAQTQQQGLSLGRRNHPDQLDVAQQLPYGVEVHRRESGQPGHAGRQVGTRRHRAQPGQQTCTRVVHVDPGEVDEQSPWAVLGQDRRDRPAEEQRAGPVRDRAALHGRAADPADGQHGVGSAGRPLDGQAVPDRALEDGTPTVGGGLDETPTGLTHRTELGAGPAHGQRTPRLGRRQGPHPIGTDQHAHGRHLRSARIGTGERIAGVSAVGGRFRTMDWTTSLADQIDWHWQGAGAAPTGRSDRP